MFEAFLPRFAGTLRPARLAADLPARLAHRVRSAGLVPLASDRRNRYEVVAQTDRSVRVRSANLLTGINIGLNDVSIAVDASDNAVAYDVSYWTWAKYSLALSALVAATVFAFTCIPLVVGAQVPWVEYSPRVILGAAIPLTLFWGGVFPWIHIAVHRRFARRALLRVLEELNDAGGA